MAGLGWHNVLQQGKYRVATLATLATEVQALQAGADMASLASGQREAEPEETRREVTLTATTHQLQSRAKSQTGNNGSQQPSASLTTTNGNAR